MVYQDLKGEISNMSKNTVDIDRLPAKLVKEYESRKKNLEEVAKEINCCKATAVRLLKKSGATMFGRGPQATFTTIPEDLLTKYYDAKLSANEIAEKMNCSYSTIHGMLKQLPTHTNHRIESRLGRAKKENEKKRRLKIVGWVRSGLTAADVAYKLNISRERVRQIVQTEAPDLVLPGRFFIVKCCFCQEVELAVKGMRNKAICPNCVAEYRQELKGGNEKYGQ